MEIILQIILIIIGFILLVKSADIFLDGAINFAYNFKIPAVIVGLTIVAFGTSAPEAAISILTLAGGKGGASLGNIVGSNVFNILGIIGVSALLGTLTVDKILIKRDFPFLVISTIGLLVIAYYYKKIDFLIGLLFLIIILAYVYYLIKKTKEDKEAMAEEGEAKFTIKKSSIYIILGIVGIAIAARIIEHYTGLIGAQRGLSDTFMGITVLAIGTSLPELVTSVTALKKGENGIVVGNVLGSCIFNILFILGISTTIQYKIPIKIFPIDLLNILIMTVVTILGAWFTYTKSEVDRKEGLVLIILYILFIIFNILLECKIIAF